MVAVAHPSPVEAPRLVLVRTTAVAAPAPARTPTPVYRRRRAIAFLLVVTVATALVLGVGGLLASFGGGPLTAPERAGSPAQVYVVQPGDTFWEIARRLDPEGDPRPLVARLVAAHGSPVLVPGERLALPSSG
jgi:hypothetical protein